MSLKVLTEDCKFTCNLNRSLYISAKDVTNTNARASRRKVLTDKSRCSVATPLQCPELTKDSGGSVPVPCALTLALPVSWSGADRKVKINGQSVLTSGSKGKCIFGGSIIPVSPGGIVSIKAASVDFSGFSDVGVTENESVQKPKNNAETLQADKKTEKDSSETDTGINENIEERDSDLFASYCRCDYSNCKEREKCEYFNAQIYVQNDSAKLSDRFKSDRRAEWEKYLLKHNEKNMISSEGGWRIAAHHIISGNQVLLMKDSQGNLLYGDIVKLANYFGYDINNAINCIMLPTNESNFGEKEPLTKIANAYEVMWLMGRQWHVGGHEYNLSRDTLENLKDYYTKNPDQYPIPGNPMFFKNYKTAMKEEMDKIQAGIREQCWKKNYEYKRERFISLLNKVSENVEEKLLSFGENPRKSFPFFVSKVSVEYAYNIPATSKIIVLYKNDSSVMAKKYRVERYMKNELKIVFNEKGGMKVHDAADFIRFCDNIMYFLIDSNIDYHIPFMPDEKDDYVVKNIEVNGVDIDVFLQSHCNEVMAFIQQNAKIYHPAAGIVSHRLNALADRIPT